MSRIQNLKFNLVTFDNYQQLRNHGISKEIYCLVRTCLREQIQFINSLNLEREKC